MPELPEVETIKNQIAPKLPLKIKKTSYSDVSGSIVKSRDFSLSNATITKVSRQGKVLLFDVVKELRGKKNNFIAISGLGMSGGWRVSERPITEKHTHIHLKCETLKGEDFYLGYVDPRRFGNFHLFTIDNARGWLTRLGADVSSVEFDASYVYERCQRYPNKMIKPFLLEQNHFAGVGNYMASEICARANILPDRAAGTLGQTETAAIVSATKTVLDGTLSSGGTTFSGGYVDATGSKGQGVTNLVVFYQKVCGLCQRSQVIKTTLQGRGTYHCPRCQK